MQNKEGSAHAEEGFSCRTVYLSLFSAAPRCLRLATVQTDRKTTVVWDCLCLHRTHARCVVLVHDELAHGS